MLLPDERHGHQRFPAGPLRGFLPFVVRLLLAAYLVYIASEPAFDGPLSEPVAVRAGAFVQLLAGVCIGLGVLTRPMALLMVIHAVVSFFLLQAGAPMRAWLPYGIVLVGALFLMLYGPGRFSLTGLASRR